VLASVAKAIVRNLRRKHNMQNDIAQQAQGLKAAA
jgi:hypothetical protein